MSKKSVSQVMKEIKKAKAREANKLAKHLEIMGSAYCQATDVPPTEVVLMSEDLKDGTKRYWYTRFDDKPNVADCHPDIKRLFDTAYAINEAKVANDQEMLSASVDVLCALVNKVRVAAEADDAAAVEERTSNKENNDEVSVHGAV